MTAAPPAPAPGGDSSRPDYARLAMGIADEEALRAMAAAGRAAKRAMAAASAS
jgi:hypothetical protein